MGKLLVKYLCSTEEVCEAGREWGRREGGGGKGEGRRRGGDIQHVARVVRGKEEKMSDALVGA